MAAEEASATALPAAWLRGLALPAAVAAVGAFVPIYFLAELSGSLGVTLLIAPFGASCVLLFALPQSPLAQPRNVIGGHVISALVGLGVLSTLGSTPVALGAAVGLAIMAMKLTGTLHPPAGANPVIVLISGAGWSFLFVPVLAGALALVAAALVYHRFVSKVRAA